MYSNVAQRGQRLGTALLCTTLNKLPHYLIRKSKDNLIFIHPVFFLSCNSSINVPKSTCEGEEKNMICFKIVKIWCLHMIILIDAEKAFDKIQHPFMIKTLPKNGHRKNIPQHSKDYI